MKTGFSKPILSWAWQVGLAIRYGAIATAWGTTHCFTFLLPGASITLCFSL